MDSIFDDYINIPSYQELHSTSVGIPLDVEAHRAYPWTSAGNVTIKEYNGSAWSNGSDSDATRYLTVRFKGAPISFSPTVYKASIASIGNNTVYNVITANNTLNVGDIWEPVNEENGILYIYVGTNEINEGAPTEYTASNNDIKYCETGGWVAAVPWWTRSYSTIENSYQGINYMYVQANGYVNTQNIADGKYYIDYSIGF